MITPVTAADIERMRDQLFFDGDARNRKLSRFWLLLPLAAVIAAAGVVADSTATVIGAMIVAPLMTPILGIALAAALTDRDNLLRSIALVLTGVIAVILISYAIGLMIDLPITAANNSQVASRVSPRLIDLLAALATGAVGAIALSRSDISDTLPGVAIAISLVPPLAVVGLTLESGEPAEAFGALLLFVANVSAILASGTVVMALYRVHHHARHTGARVVRRGRTIVVIALMVVLVAIPLAFTSATATNATLRENAARTASTEWADQNGWSLVSISEQEATTVIRFTGPSPAPDTAGLRKALDDAGLADLTIRAELVPGTFETLAPVS